MTCSLEAATVNLDFPSVRIFCSTFARTDCRNKFQREYLNRWALTLASLLLFLYSYNLKIKHQRFCVVPKANLIQVILSYVESYQI